MQKPELSGNHNCDGCMQRSCLGVTAQAAGDVYVLYMHFLQTVFDKVDQTMLKPWRVVTPAARRKMWCGSRHYSGMLLMNV